MAVETLTSPARRGWLRYRMPIWSTGAELVVADPASLFAAVNVLRAETARTDSLANRFHPCSEVSRVNEGAGRAVPVSEAFLELLAESFRVARATGGAVDPTVGGALLRLGYDRDIGLVDGAAPDRLPPVAPVPGWREVRVDLGERTVTLPPGAALDLGATAKARTADRVAAAVADRCGCGVIVSLGGDVAVGGPVPEDGFPVGVGERWDGDASDVVAIRQGGLATSGTTARRWTVAGQEVHHVVDPSTGRSADTPWRTVTVAAGSCVDANAAATAALVMGDTAPAWLRLMGLSARLVATDGTCRLVREWPERAAPGVPA